MRRTRASDAWTPALAGLLAALVLLLAGALYFGGQAVTASGQEVQVRKATVAAESLADLVGVLAATGDPEPARLSAMVEVWRQKDPAVRAVRIVRHDRRELLLSTDPADLTAGAAPRPLVRAEKPLFDLAGALFGNADSNRAEDLARLPELDVRGIGDGALRVTVPIRADGRAWGVAQVDRAGPAPGGGPWPLAALTAAPLSLAILAGLGLALGRFAATRPALARWALFAAAALLLAGVATLVAHDGRANLGAAREAHLGALRDTVTALSDGTAKVAAIADLRLSGRSWDVDVQRRPRGELTPTGTIDAAVAARRVEAMGRGLERQLWITAGLALGLLAFVALGGAARTAATLREHRLAYGYVAPAVIGMLVLVFFPFMYGLVLSFTDSSLVNQSLPLSELWVGFANYVSILGDIDVLRWTPDGMVVNYESFYWTLFITICWTVANVAIGVVVGTALALALNTEGLRGKTVYRVLLILPWAIPNYITALTWKGMFHPQFGVINQAIVLFGGEPVQWFDGVFTSFLTGLVTNGWLSFPFMMVIVLGALAAIPQDMYEAARLDGASRWQQFRMITLPMLKPALIPAIILSVVWTFNMFNVIYLVSAGEPGGANEILITKAYKLAFERYQYAYAAAYSMVIFLILFAYGLVQNRATRATEAVA